MSGPLSLTQAAKVSGRAKATISKAIRKGELSAKQEGNSYLIEPAELFRVFPAQSTEPEAAPAAPPADPALQVRVEMLERLLAQAEAALEREREDRQAAEARAEEERRRIDRLLPPPDAKPRRRWFSGKAR